MFKRFTLSASVLVLAAAVLFAAVDTRGAAADGPTMPSPVDSYEIRGCRRG